MSNHPGSGSFTASIAPWLTVVISAEAVEFYKIAFGAEEVYRLENGGSVVARLSVLGAEFWVGDESAEHFNYSPQGLGGSTVRLIFSVADPDGVVDRAVAAGCTEIYPVANRHGWRLGRIADPFGHQWEIGRPPAEA